MKNRLIASNGSVQGLNIIPKDVQELFKTVYELKASDLIKMAAARGRFIDQSQSLNIHLEDVEDMRDAFFLTWELGLKGSYYMRTKAVVEPTQITVDQQQLKSKHVDYSKILKQDKDKDEDEQKQEQQKQQEKRVIANLCSLKNKEDCMSCGS